MTITAPLTVHLPCGKYRNIDTWLSQISKDVSAIVTILSLSTFHR